MSSPFCLSISFTNIGCHIPHPLANKPVDITYTMALPFIRRQTINLEKNNEHDIVMFKIPHIYAKSVYSKLKISQSKSNAGYGAFLLDSTTYVVS